MDRLSKCRHFGFSSDVTCTWSKQMDTLFGESSENGVQAIGGQWHPEWSYGPSDGNHTNRCVAALVYELPGKTLGNRFLREAIGGWQISSIATFEPGRPTSVWNGYTSSFDYMGDVDDQTCDGNLPRGKRSFIHQINVDCYFAPAPDTDTGIATHRRPAAQQRPPARNQQLGFVVYPRVSLWGAKSERFSSGLRRLTLSTTPNGNRSTTSTTAL